MMNHKRQQLQKQKCTAKKQKKTKSSNSSNVSRLIAYLQLCNNTTAAASASSSSSSDRCLDAPEPSASSLLIISRLLRTRNTLMDLVTMVSSCCSWSRSSCSRRRLLVVAAKDHGDEEHDVEDDYNDDDDDDSCNAMNLIAKKEHLNATTLGLLLSAIYQNELCQESTEHLLAKSCKISCGSSHTRTNSYHCNDNTMMQPQPGSKRIIPYFILNFVLQILHTRYKDVLYVPLLQNHDESTTMLLEMMACWKSNMKNGQCPRCTTSSSSCELLKCRHLGSSVGKDCLEMSQEEFWIPCIAFMMAFQIFKKRLESKCYIVRKIKDCHSSLKCEFSCYIFSKDKKEEILMDPVVVGVMRLIYWSKILAFGMRRFFWNHQEDKKDNDTVDDHNNSNNDKEDGAGIHKRDDPLRLFFSKELDWIDVFVSWIMEETTTLSCPTHKDDTSCAFVMDCNGHGKEQEKNNLDTNRQEDTSSFQQLWAYFENHSDDDVQGNKDYITLSNGVEDASHQDVKMASCKQRSTEKTYVMNAVALRPELWKMSKNAISQDITEMTEKIITLLNDAGSEDGAMGIEVVATVLATGDTTKQQQKDNADLEQLYVDIFPFSDSLLAGITKKYITEEMSSARIFSFLGSFVLPSIIALARKESRPVTRQLVTMLINLARDRPCEVMGALVIPTMQGTTHLTPTQHDNDTKRKINSKGQSELITRLIKSKCFGTPELSKLALELVRVEWTDQSIAVFMTCLQRKPSLCSATFSTLVERIYICCDKKVLVGSTNYSSFFHTIVTKYSTQVKQEEHVETLLTAANSLTTFLKKTIISALMKMKSV